MASLPLYLRASLTAACLFLPGQQTGAAVARDSQQPVPTGARASLQFEKGTSYTLGDVISLTFVLSNAGTVPITYSTGGDYRGTGFPLRYKFTAVDDAGNALPAESWQGAMQMGGGLSGNRELKPGEEYKENLLLHYYIQVSRPGTFTLRVVHDFGWIADPNRPLPAAEAKISVALPTPSQAEARVRAIAAAYRATAEAAAATKGAPSPVNPPTATGAFVALLHGSFRTPWHRTEYRFLNHPVFLPALETVAGEGQLAAMEGIHRLESEESTRSLLRLLKSANPDVMHTAALLLSRKMPGRTVTGPWGTGVRYPGGVNTPDQAAALARFWLPEAVDPLRAAAATLLLSKDVNRVTTGATIVEFIGTPADGPAMLEALKPITEYLQPRSKPDDNILNFPGAGDALVEAMGALRERGYRAPQSGGMNIILAQFLELADPAIPRSANAERMLQSFFNAQHPVLGVAAVRALPKPATGPWAPLLERALNAPDRGVLMAACVVAGDSGSRELATTLANIVRTESNQFLLEQATIALDKLAGHLPSTDAWIERIADESLAFNALRYLFTKLEHPKHTGGSGSGTSRVPFDRNARVALREKWIQFLEDPSRRALVGQGKPVPVTSEQARLLFGGFYVFYVETPGGGSTQWPPP